MARLLPVGAFLLLLLLSPCWSRFDDDDDDSPRREKKTSDDDETLAEDSESILEEEEEEGGDNKDSDQSNEEPEAYQEPRKARPATKPPTKKVPPTKPPSKKVPATKPPAKKEPVPKPPGKKVPATKPPAEEDEASDEETWRSDLGDQNTPIESPIDICAKDKPCTCEDSKVECEGESLQSVNLRTPSGEMKIRYLRMRNNWVKRLEKGKIVPGHVKELEVLDLSVNPIEEIEDGAFNGFTALRELKLRETHLKNVTRSTWKGLDWLISLDLANSQLEDLSGPIFRELSDLEHLILDGNPLRSISKLSFANLPRLTTLSLDDTKLDGLREDWFVSLHNLQTLSIRNSRFRVVPSLRGLVGLTNLDLSGAPMPEINSNAFKDLPKLLELRLERMPELWAVEDCAFCGIHELHTLVISGCPKLRVVDRLAFGFAPKADFYFRNSLVLDFSNNSLSGLPTSLLPWANVSRLNMATNPLVCDCTAEWLKEPGLKKVLEPTPMCVLPENLKGKPATLVQGSEMVCSRLSGRSGRFFLSALLIVLLGVSLTLAWYMWLGRRRYQKFRLWFSRPRLPKFAYKNLAMRADDEEAIYTKEGGKEEPLPLPAQL